MVWLVNLFVRDQATGPTGSVVALVAIVELLVQVDDIDVIIEEYLRKGLKSALVAHVLLLIPIVPMFRLFVKGHFVSTIGCERALFTPHQLV